MTSGQKHVIGVVDHPSSATHGCDSAYAWIDGGDSIVVQSALRFTDHRIVANLRGLDGD